MNNLKPNAPIGDLTPQTEGQLPCNCWCTLGDYKQCTVCHGTGCRNGQPTLKVGTAADKADLCPPHYAGTVTPWDLQKCMVSSGNAFVDSRRTDAIEYCFRMKVDLLGDLRKARHCLDEAIKVMEQTEH